MRALIVAPVLLLVGVMLGGAPAAMAGPAAAQVAATDLSAQAARRQRARTRIRVTPLRRGGTLVRECSFRLVREARASGSYVVPQQRCWWARR